MASCVSLLAWYRLGPRRPQAFAPLLRHTNPGRLDDLLATEACGVPDETDTHVAAACTYDQSDTIAPTHGPLRETAHIGRLSSSMLQGQVRFECSPTRWRPDGRPRRLRRARGIQKIRVPEQKAGSEENLTVWA